MYHSDRDSHENYYQILGLDQDVHEKQIKSAYRKLALTYHPDKNPGDKIALERFKRITEAYGVLIDPVKRKEYDQYLLHAERLNRVRMGFGGHGYTDILNDIFKNPASREVFEQMAKGGSIRMDERFLREILAGGFLFGGIFFGFWGISPFGLKVREGRIHFGESSLDFSHILSTLKERFKSGLVKGVHQIKGFWASIGSGSNIEDKRHPKYQLEITPEEAKQGITKIFSIQVQGGIQKYQIKIPAGIKDGMNLKITDKDSKSFYLLIKIING
ncbi:MAG: DnaJ domain-containing protein [bacterium]